jgi:putative transposase
VRTVRNYKFRIFPTQQQEQKLEETIDGCRWVYNYFVNNGFESEYDMNYALTELKEQEPWLRNYHSKMLQMVGKQVAASAKALKVLRKNGHKVGKLHYMTHDEYNSFTYNQSGFKIEKHGNTDLLWLSKVGYSEIRLHRKPVNIKQITIVRQAGKWYAVVCCETAKPLFHFIEPSKSVGIDVGITRFAHDSNNQKVENPLFLTRMLKPLRRAHRKVSRRKRGSNNYGKAKNVLARLYQRIHNKRKDFLHKLSSYYSGKYDIIFLERLRTLNMAKNHSVARYVLDSSWRTFMLGYKAKLLVEVEPYNTSVGCSRCGNKVPKSLAVRTHHCDECGLVIGRDYNASLNILQRGLSNLPVECREVTPAEIAKHSLKQEKIVGIVEQ